MPSETTEILFERYGPAYRWLAIVTVMLGTISTVPSTISGAPFSIIAMFGMVALAGIAVNDAIVKVEQWE